MVVGRHHTDSEASRATPAWSVPWVVMAVVDSIKFVLELRARRLVDSDGNGTMAGHMPPDLLVAVTMLVICQTACCRSVLMFTCRIHTSSVVADLTSACSPVTEIPFVDESSEWELLSLLGDWYEPESYESIFSSIASNAVFFSS